MLKALLLLLTNLAIAAIATAQNLVTNPSFEDTIDCESLLQCDLLRAAGWYNPNTATPDVYDCDLTRDCGQPMDPLDVGIQVQGFQYAFDGVRVAGGYQWEPGGYTREYLMTKLTSELQAGHAYEVALYCSRAEGYRYAVDRISVYLGPDSVFENHPNNLTTVAPQVQLMDPNSTYLEEGLVWVQLTDTFVAQGGERWMVIGTFLGPDDVNVTIATPGATYLLAYYYFDQVVVRPIGEGNGIQELLASAGLTEGAINLTWKGKDRLDRLILVDATGRTVVDMGLDMGPGTHVIALPVALPAGLYFVLGLHGQQRYVARFVKGE